MNGKNLGFYPLLSGKTLTRFKCEYEVMDSYVLEAVWRRGWRCPYRETNPEIAIHGRDDEDQD